MLPITFAKQICRSNAAKSQSIYKVYKLVVHAQKKTMDNLYDDSRTQQFTDLFSAC